MDIKRVGFLIGIKTTDHIKKSIAFASYVKEEAIHLTNTPMGKVLLPI